jgi:hypothetical protein
MHSAVFMNSSDDVPESTSKGDLPIPHAGPAHFSSPSVARRLQQPIAIQAMKITSFLITSMPLVVANGVTEMSSDDCLWGGQAAALPSSPNISSCFCCFNC